MVIIKNGPSARLHSDDIVKSCDTKVINGEKSSTVREMWHQLI